MSLNYLVGFTFCSFGSREKFNAMSKARIDVEKTCRDLGFEISNINVSNQSIRFIVHLSVFWTLIKKAIILARRSKIYVQYPIAYPQISWIFYRILKIKRCELIYIVHDIEMLRYHYKWERYEVRVLNMADALLVHTDNMREELRRLGVKKPMTTITLFDYYTSSSSHQQELLLANKNVVAFAGNLAKSGFIRLLYKNTIPGDILYRLYGLKGDVSFDDNPKMEYCQSFKPEDVHVLEAGWGLVWDGNDIHTCSGLEGKYLKYNSSHKASLYIVVGIPLIVWKESALATYVESNGLGISVSSILDIPEIIQNISNEEYSKYVENVAKLSDRLKRGDILKTILRS